MPRNLYGYTQCSIDVDKGGTCFGKTVLSGKLSCEALCFMSGPHFSLIFFLISYDELMSILRIRLLNAKVEN